MEQSSGPFRGPPVVFTVLLILENTHLALVVQLCTSLKRTTRCAMSMLTQRCIVQHGGRHQHGSRGHTPTYCRNASRLTLSHCWIVCLFTASSPRAQPIPYLAISAAALKNSRPHATADRQRLRENMQNEVPAHKLEVLSAFQMLRRVNGHQHKIAWDCAKLSSGYVRECYGYAQAAAEKDICGMHLMLRVAIISCLELVSMSKQHVAVLHADFAK
ncbi:uncharacterized protein LOC106945143 [Poecilia latipinna]|uniref:uncharacterized protein LOC106945143 n=1 Tax=Poecilia latipinna TaxID=48699 RepID=UPI00072DEEB0|nr:PREDICTED: uncharacterized protein LOC106945143 [Poecilia latipinna]